MDNFTTGTIVIGKHTAFHPGRLQDLGYDVEAVSAQGERTKILVKVLGFVDEVDISSGDAALLELVTKRMAMTYKTKVKFEDGKILSGLPACSKLGPRWSCLMMMPPPPPLAGRTEVQPPMTDIFKEILKMSNEIAKLRAEIAKLRQQ